MNIPTIVLLLSYTTIIVSFIWARIRYFRIKSRSSRVGTYMFDPAVAIQIIASYYSLLSNSREALIPDVAGLLLYTTGFGLFWWSIVTAKQLDFAFSDNVGKIITTGPFAIVRHPLYLSYTLVWLTSTLLFNSFYLWITLTYLVSFYFISAKREEKVILKSDYSREYRNYSQKVGMFLPRISSWKS